MVSLENKPVLAFTLPLYISIRKSKMYDNWLGNGPRQVDYEAMEKGLFKSKECPWWWRRYASWSAEDQKYFDDEYDNFERQIHDDIEEQHDDFYPFDGYESDDTDYMDDFYGEFGLDSVF